MVEPAADRVTVHARGCASSPPPPPNTHTQPHIHCICYSRSDWFSYTINRFIFTRGFCLHNWSIEMFHFVYILDSNFRIVFAKNFDTKRGNALSWEIFSLNHCALFIDIETKGKVFWK